MLTDRNFPLYAISSSIMVFSSYYTSMHHFTFLSLVVTDGDLFRCLMLLVYAILSQLPYRLIRIYTHTGTQGTAVVNNAFSLLLSRKYKREANKSILERGRKTAAQNDVCIKSVCMLDDPLKQHL